MTRTTIIPACSRAWPGDELAPTSSRQAEAGYRLGANEPAAASLTPFAQFEPRRSSGAFSETGANSLHLNVAEQTTTSMRGTLGAQIRAAIAAGRREAGAAVSAWLGARICRYDGPVTAGFQRARHRFIFRAAPQRDSASAAANVATPGCFLQSPLRCRARQRHRQPRDIRWAADIVVTATRFLLTAPGRV
jgi:formylglycine-generating enzyme required for sulfatase activity